MKKLLLSCMMLLGFAGATYADDVITYEPDEVFTSLSVNDVVAIYNADAKKYLFGSGNQMLGFDVAESAFIAGNSGWLFKVETYDGHYMFHLQTPGGEDYSVWGNPGYLNSQPITSNDSFILGLVGDNHDHGQDGDFLALWDIEEVEGGFVLKNVGTNMYLKENRSAKFSKEQATVWTFCTLKETKMENPIPQGSYDAADANTEAFANFTTIDENATWDSATKIFTKRCGFVWSEGIDLSKYRYIVITAAQSRENAGAGNVLIKDASGKVIQGDDYKGGKYGMWLSLWNALNSCVIDLESLRGQMFDIHHITELSIDGGDKFVLGNVYATNFETATTGRWDNKDGEGNFRVKGLTANQYGTVCLPYQAAVSGAYIFQVAGKTEDGIALAPVDGLLEAGVPYIFKPTETVPNGDGVYPANTVYFYQTTATTVTKPGSKNGLIGTFTNLNDGEYVVISKNEDNQSELMKKANVSANQAYFDMENISVSEGETALVYNDADIEPEVDPGVKPIPEGYISIIENGTLEGSEVKSFEFLTPTSSGRHNAEIVEGAGRAGSNGIKVVSGDNPSQVWDTQFFVRFNNKIPTGTKIHFEFDYRANKSATISTQQHHEPQTYAGGGFQDITADVEWNHFEGDLTVSPNTNGNDDIESIAFNLAHNTVSTEYYFDNFLAYMEKPVAITDWVELVDPDKSFVSKEQGKNADPWLISSQDGEVTVMSADGASVDWDSQFFIKLSKKLPKGTKYKFSIDYKADKEAHVYMQSHKAPGAYAGNGNYGDFTCGTSYATHTKGTNEAPGVTNDDGIWTIAFNLAQNKSATTFNFKNISFKVPADVYETLEDAPAAVAEPEPSITIVSEYATFVPGYSMNIGNNEDLVAYNVAYNAEKNSVELTETSKLPVGQAILLYAEGGADTFSDGIEIERILDAQTGLKAAAGGDNPTKGDGSTIYVLANGKKGWGFYLLAADVVIPVGKGYLQIEAAGGREFIGFADDATTVKALENLKKSGTIYNLAGQQVKSAQKGIFIIDGKKTILK